MAGFAGGAIHGKFRNLAGTVQSLRSSEDITIFGVQVLNASGATAYIQLFDVATAAGVTLGSTTPDLEIEVAAAATVSLAIPACGVAFGKGCQLASTTAEGGSSGSASGVQVFVQYI